MKSGSACSDWIRDKNDWSFYLILVDIVSIGFQIRHDAWPQFQAFRIFRNWEDDNSPFLWFRWHSAFLPTIRHSIYDFRVTYLYFCSILWRASVTGINYFRKADLNNGMNERLRKVIYHKTLSIDNVYLIHNM